MDVQQWLKAYLSQYQDYKPYWNYEDGCVLIGSMRMYEATGDSAYSEYVRDYLLRRVAADGTIPTYEVRQYNIDSINSGKTLFFAEQHWPDPRWRPAIEYHMQRLSGHPRCQNGSFWHKEIYPWQVWLDGLYMALPFYMAYEMRYGGMRQVKDIMLQFDNVAALLYDHNKKLSYHGWDESRQMYWADPETGLSQNFWLRAMGWYLMAMVDCLEALDEQLFEHHMALREQFKRAAQGIVTYQHQSGLFYQLIDLSDEPGNYLETSGSAMVAYALMKGARIGVLNDEKYAPLGRKALDALVRDKLTLSQNGGQLNDICLVAGLGGEGRRDGSVAYYLSEPRVADDAKGVGPFMMAYAEACLQDRADNGKGE